MDLVSKQPIIDGYIPIASNESGAREGMGEKTFPYTCQIIIHANYYYVKRIHVVYKKQLLIESNAENCRAMMTNPYPYII